MKLSTVKGYKLVWLADEPQYIETCAAWNFTQWGIKSDKNTLQKSIDSYALCKNKDKIPLTILFIDEERNVPVAMGSIWEKDSEYWQEPTPWIASIFVHDYYRNKGLAKALIENLEMIGRHLGISKIYLTASEGAAGLYEKMKYTVLETHDAPEMPQGKETLFVKELRS